MTLGRTVWKQSRWGDSSVGSVHTSLELCRKWLVGTGQLTLKQAGTFHLFMAPWTVYAPCVTCIFSFFTFLTLIFMSYNLGENASTYFAGQNSG